MTTSIYPSREPLTRLPTCSDACVQKYLYNFEHKNLDLVLLHDPLTHEGVCSGCASRITPRYEADGLMLDVDRYEASVDGRMVSFTARDWAVLTLLVAVPGVPVTHRQLWEGAEPGAPFEPSRWPRRGGSTEILRMIVFHIRERLDVSARQRFVQTVPMVGYRLGAPR